jgi:ABC-2 type transport system permease protein
MILPLMCTLLIFINNNPELARRLGLVSAKAQMFGTATDWQGYLALVMQAVAMGGFFFFCIIIAWVFGREFADGTLKDLLPVPVPRSSILLAKFIVVAVWSLLLALVVLAASLFSGRLIALGGCSMAVLLQGSLRLVLVTMMTVLVVVPFALAASAGRGYLLPLGMAIIALVLANVAAVAGWGEYFPWAIPGLYAQDMPLLPVSYLIVGLTGLLGMVATYIWWVTADQSR